MAARFAPVDVEVDLQSLPNSERAALAKLIAASRYIDALFVRQRPASNEALLLELLADESADTRAHLRYFLLNKGPWSELDDDRPFIAGVEAKTGGGNFYPANTTREEVDAWMTKLSAQERSDATGFFTTIRRDPSGGFQSVPYSLEYQGELAQMSRLGERETTVRQELKELNGPLAEAKADISGLWALQQLMDKGVIDKKQERSMYMTFLASSFRTLRFGLNAAHAKGMALQLNRLLDSGAVTVNKEGEFSLDLAKTKKAVVALTRDIMMLQARGDYSGVKQLMDRMVVIRPEVQRVIDKLEGVPVDIAPKFITAEQLSN
jgi:hypothetical protein